MLHRASLALAVRHLLVGEETMFQTGTPLERIREALGVLRTQTQVVLSTLFERPFAAE